MQAHHLSLRRGIITTGTVRREAAMRHLTIALLALATSVAVAEEPKTPTVAEGTRIYQTDPYGRLQLHKPSLVVKEGRVVTVSPYGRTLSHEQQYVIQGDRVYHADAAGQVQRNKTSWTVGKDGRVIPNDAYGNPQYHKPQYAIKDDKVYATDATGRVKRPAYEIKK
jgi:hypothetical protein